MFYEIYAIYIFDFVLERLIVICKNKFSRRINVTLCACHSFSNNCSFYSSTHHTLSLNYLAEMNVVSLSCDAVRQDVGIEISLFQTSSGRRPRRISCSLAYKFSSIFLLIDLSESILTYIKRDVIIAIQMNTCEELKRECQK